MVYDKSHRTSSFRTIYSPLFIKLIRGYKTIIVCKINYGLLYLTPIWNV